jgi:hypothetical protein
VRHHNQLDEIEEFIESLQQLKDGNIEADSVDGQTLIQATIMIFQLLRDEYETDMKKKGKH